MTIAIAPSASGRTTATANTTAAVTANGVSGAKTPEKGGFASALSAHQSPAPVTTAAASTPADPATAAATPGKILPPANPAIAAPVQTPGSPTLPAVPVTAVPVPTTAVMTEARAVPTPRASLAPREKGAKADSSTSDPTDAAGAVPAQAGAMPELVPQMPPALMPVAFAPPAAASAADPAASASPAPATLAAQALAAGTALGAQGQSPQNMNTSAVPAAPAARRSAALSGQVASAASASASAAGAHQAAVEAKTGSAATPAAPANAPSTTGHQAGAEAKGEAGAKSAQDNAKPATTPSITPQLTPALAHAPLFNVAPAAATPAAETPTDFGALVDSIARARAESTHAGSAAVGVTLSHTDFGRVGLQFSARADGLSVTMHSNDPGFAPAVVAAAAPSAGSSAGNHSGNPSGQQPGYTPTQDTQARNTGADPQGGTGNGQRGDTPQHGPSPTLAVNRSSGTATASDATDTSGIFA
jgi:Meckel syndrome type 1 protein